jgi:hypothetical protein
MKITIELNCHHCHGTKVKKNGKKQTGNLVKVLSVPVKSHYIIKPQRLHYSSLEVDEFWTHVGKKEKQSVVNL